MFESLIQRVLEGILGRYVRNIQKDQLKLSLWNEEVLLQNVELIPEAFDYLQFPFALKLGRVGRLSIKISWKKLGWDCPIIIVLEDVFICASQRDDSEWSMEAIEKREFAGKRAMLATAELAKLSRHVSGNQTGKSFISYITAKVLDSIQLSIKNFHVQYSGIEHDLVHCGLKFSSLTIKQNLVGYLGQKVVGGQVNKSVGVEGLEIYCATSKNATDTSSLDRTADSRFLKNERSEGNALDNLIQPLDVTVSLVVNKAGRLDTDLAQYSIRAEITNLVMSLNEVQLQQILILFDYINLSRLRKKYGRYRPLGHSSSRKKNGWQILWWHYAQQSILSDVRRKLKKSSWRYLGQRLDSRRKYIKLYKIKLESLQQELPIDEYILKELEQMEKESDVDDILNYRSAAERELQEVPLSSSSSNIGVNGANVSVAKSQNNERSLGKSQGWLNWLSRGMLGAGGTDDSGQFSGVVSDEVVKDIYEATEFHPSALSSGEADATDRIFTCVIKLSVAEVAATLRSKFSDQRIAVLVFKDVVTECKLWDELASVICYIESAKMVCPDNKKIILQIGKPLIETKLQEDELTACRVQVDMSPMREVELSVKVMLEPLEVTCDVEFFVKFVEFFNVVKCSEFQHKRVIWSLNGFKDVKTRLLSKVEYALSNRKKLSWDVSILNTIINVPGRKGISEQCNLVLKIESLQCTSIYDEEFVASTIQELSHIDELFSSSSFSVNSLSDFLVKDLYDYFAIKLENLDLKTVMPHHVQAVNILEGFCTSVNFASCIISDESISKQLEVCAAVPSVDVNFSLPIYESIMALVTHLHMLHSTTRSLIPRSPFSPSFTSSQPLASTFGFSVTSKLNSVTLHVDLANDGECNSKLMLFLQGLDFRYCHMEFEECFISMRAVRVINSPFGGENDGCILLSSENQFTSGVARHQGLYSRNSNLNGRDKGAVTEDFFLMHYESNRSVDFDSCKFTISLSDADLHCYPHVVGLLIRFYESLSSYGASLPHDKYTGSMADGKKANNRPGFQFQRFGYSNFLETGSSENATISLDCYPFITISNSSSLGNLESSLGPSIPNWRQLFKLRDKKLGSPIFSVKRESKAFQVSSVMQTYGMGAITALGSIVDITLWGVRVHFHDSSCIVGTITIPTSKCSISIYEDSMDLLFSVEGLILTSPWWTKNLKDFLWGPSLPNLPSILNLRVRKRHASAGSSQLEVSIGVQHVYCFLPPEFLSIIIGYFSLSDWTSNFNEHPVSPNRDHVVSEKGTVMYKFEILDSTLILAVEQDDHRFLKTELRQLCSSFILECSPDDVVKDIPSDCLVPSHKIAKANDCLNLFGRDLSLCLLWKDDEYGCFMVDEGTGCGNITLLQSLNADVWVRLPCESECFLDSSFASMCVMARISECQFNADDCYTLNGYEALVDVINQFSSVGSESKIFTSDVLHFFQLKRRLKENGAFSPVTSDPSFTEVQCCADSLSINLFQLGKSSVHSHQGSVQSQLIAKADMQFICSVSLIDDTPVDMDLSFTSLELHSLLNCVTVAQCTEACPALSVLHIRFSKSIKGENEVHFSLPSLDLWLHVSDWSAIIDLFNSFSKRMAETEGTEASSKNLLKDNADVYENANPTKEHTKQDSASLFVKSENVGLTFNFPLLDTGELGTHVVQEERSQNVSLNATEGKNLKFMALTAHSRNIELAIVQRDVKLKSIIDKINGSIGICEDKNITSWPFFQVSQASVLAEIFSNQADILNIKMEVQVDYLQVWLSHRVSCFWYNVQFEIPEAGTSDSSLGNMNFEIQLKKLSLLISDERWSCGGPLLEILMRNSLLNAFMTQNNVESSVIGDIEMNYNNIHKVLWEPFVEPWNFQIDMLRRKKLSTLLNSSVVTDIHLKSTAPLNLNITESVIECIVRTVEMFKDAWHLVEPTDICETQRFLSPQFAEPMSGGRFAPYILQNLTSLPLIYHVFQGPVTADELDFSEIMDGKSVEPGASVPIYLNETPEQQLYRIRRDQSSNRLSERQSNGVVHHFMSIQLDGMSLPSAAISMDLVGLTYFEVDFSNSSNKPEAGKTGDYSKYSTKFEEVSINGNGFAVPVLFDVSVQRYSKLIRLYSTVILSNATSVPLELRFDIPFGLSPKILDPIYPGQEIPLPLHLAGAGRLRWRPLGNSYLWSAVHDLSSILSQEIKVGFLRSFVCYPSHPSNDPFRCCISVQNFSVPSSNKVKKVTNSRRNSKHSKKQFVYQVTLSTPLVVNSYLSDSVSLTIDSGGVSCSALLSEVGKSFHHVDPSHDLGLEFCIQGFKPSALKFPRTETFSGIAKFSGTKFSIIETMIFNPESSNGPLYVTAELMMDAFSGAREIFIFVPFLLYNCTGLPFDISESVTEIDGNQYTVPPCYLIERECLPDKDGLSLLSADQQPYTGGPRIDDTGSSLENQIFFARKNAPLLGKYMHKTLVVSDSLGFRESDEHTLASKKAYSKMCSTSQSTSKDPNLADSDYGKVKACMYSPCAISSAGEVMVRVRRCLPEHVAKKERNSSWSEPFLLVPPSGSQAVLIPQSSHNASYIISVTSSPLVGPFAGRTRAITFQPRYIISNACSRDLCYRQKGTNLFVHLGIGKHSHLHWTDTMRELLVSIRFNEPGWQWSGSFLPDHLGDTQVKMRNFMSGSLNMVRVEVQNADVSIRDEKIVGSLHGNSGTNLILLSDDDTGFMPYRIDNFSKEKLRIFQQGCETFDTIVHPYTSCQYAWDEPCSPHRLTVEVPGERVIGLYSLDDLREFVPVHLKPTSEKPERTLLLSCCADGATKVLSIVDSGYHILKDLKDPSPSWFQVQNKYEHKEESSFDYKEKFSLAISCVGISLINAYPQELLFACVKDISLSVLQSLDQQKLSFQISSLQIDNQLRTTTYPVIMYFNQEHRSNATNQRVKDDAAKFIKERALQISSEIYCEPVVHLDIATWRKKDISLVSFEYISISVSNFRLELEQELILNLLDFFKSVSLRLQSKELPISDPAFYPPINVVGLTESRTYEYVKTRETQLHGTNIPVFDKNKVSSLSLPSVVPIGAPWQQIHLLARRQKKIYVELFNVAPIKFTLSFSSAPWILRNGVLTSGESIVHRSLMALADVEGARIHLKELSIAHQLASWESMQDILLRHYSRQFLHEMYKVFGSAGVIGNPIGFARSLGLGIRDFLSIPARSFLQSPTGLITGMAQGTASLLSNTVYALSDATTQFSKAAHKGIVAFTFDDQSVSTMQKQQKGVINEVLEGFTGLLQSPIKEAEKHGLPGVLSGIALGVTGLIARPAASILEMTGKTAQSIRNKSKLYQLGSQRRRIRLPRPLSRELPLRPYSLEEAVGTLVLLEADEGLKLKDEVFVMCKSLKQAGKFVVLTERLMLIVSCPGLADMGKPEFRGVPVDPDWLIESEISLDSVIHADNVEGVVHIVGSSSDARLKQSKKGDGSRTREWSNPSTRLPLFQTNLELASTKDAEDLLQIMLNIIEQGKGRGWSSGYLLHKSNVICK